jgi:glucose 1-dehydrogenase
MESSPIVIGADSGIGQATAIAFVEEGAEHTACRVESTGGKAAVFQLDQRNSASVARLFQSVGGGLGNADHPRQ